MCGSDTSVDPAAWTVRHGINNVQLDPSWLGAATDSVLFTLTHDGPIDLGGGVLDPSAARHVFLTSRAPDGGFRWAQHFGGAPGTITFTSYEVATDCAGNVVIAGFFHDSMDIQGTVLSATPGFEFDDGMGFPTVDWFIIKFEPDGGLLWARRFGDDRSQRLAGLGLRGDGTIIVIGEANGTLELGGAPIVADPLSPVVLAAFDPDGEFLWQRTFVQEGLDFLNLAVGGAEDAISVLAQCSLAIDLGGGEIAAGGVSSYILVQYDGDGEHRWSLRWPHAEQTMPSGLGTDAAGGMVIQGSASPAYLVRYDADGVFDWLRTFPTDKEPKEYVNLGAPHVDQEILITGSLQGSVDFGGGELVGPVDRRALIVARYDLTGEHLDSSVHASTAGSFGKVAAVGQDGEVLVGGRWSGSLDLGEGPMPAIGTYDVFVHRFAQ